MNSDMQRHTGNPATAGMPSAGKRMISQSDMCIWIWEKAMIWDMGCERSFGIREWLRKPVRR